MKRIFSIILFTVILSVSVYAKEKKDAIVLFPVITSDKMA